MLVSFMASEAKKWLRDSMTAFMLFYPLLFGVIGRWVIPWIADTAGFFLDPFIDVVLGALTIMAAHVYGALVGFSILDDREDHIFTSVRVSLLPVHQFIAFRLLLTTVLAFVTAVYVILFSNLASFTMPEVLSIALIASLAAPMVSLLINVLAKNKIEGFAIMKGIVAIFIIFPVAALFFSDAREWFFAFAPGFWAAKTLSTAMHGGHVASLDFTAYVWLGLGYVLLLNLLAYGLFRKRVLD